MGKSKRLEWLDVSKALGVYLVILGHLVIFNYHTFRFIFAFHMPFFFLASGYVTGKKETFGKFIKKCCRYYLIPYAVVLVLGFLQCLLVPIWGHDFALFIRPDILEKSFYGGHPVYSFFGSAWFLLSMFWAQLIFYGLLRAGEKLKKYISVLLWIVLIFLAVFSGDVFSFIPYFGKLPFKLDSALMGTVFLGIGYLLKKSKILEKSKNYLAVLYFMIGALCTWLFGCRWNYYVNLCDCEYAKEYNYFIAAVAGSIMLFGLGQLLQKSKLLQYIGRNTLFIFLAHEFIYVAIIYFINQVFHMELKSQGMPLNGWSIGISVLTLILGTLLCWGYQKLKTILGRKNSGLHKE